MNCRCRKIKLRMQSGPNGRSGGRDGQWKSSIEAPISVVALHWGGKGGEKADPGRRHDVLNASHLHICTHPVLEAPMGG